MEKCFPTVLFATYVTICRLIVVVIVLAAENIPHINLRNTAALPILGRIKIRIGTGYVDPTA